MCQLKGKKYNGFEGLAENTLSLVIVVLLLINEKKDENDRMCLNVFYMLFLIHFVI